jgi:hypothetical protein
LEKYSEASDKISEINLSRGFALSLSELWWTLNSNKRPIIESRMAQARSELDVRERRAQGRGPRGSPRGSTRGGSPEESRGGEARGGRKRKFKFQTVHKSTIEKYLKKDVPSKLETRGLIKFTALKKYPNPATSKSKNSKLSEDTPLFLLDEGFSILLRACICLSTSFRRVYRKDSKKIGMKETLASSSVF